MANRSVAELRKVTESIFTAAGAPADLATEMADEIYVQFLGKGIYDEMTGQFGEFSKITI